MSDVDTLRELTLWAAPPRIVPIAEGRTNRNFAVYDGVRSYFARIGKDLPHHGIYRQVERQALALAAATDIAPALVYARDGLLVTEFIDGRTLTRGDIDDHRLAAIAALLVRLHRNAGDGLPVFSPIDASLRYLEQLPDAALPVERQRIRGRLSGLPTPEPVCFVHGDLIPENFIESAQGLRLVDWEYAGRGVPETDLALVIANFDLDPRQASILLEAYGTHSPDHLAALRDAAIVREYLWCLVQLRQGEPPEELLRYTELCHQRLLELGL